MRYLLVYHIADYAENGGGAIAEDFQNENEMHNRVNELAELHKEIFSVKYAGWLQTEFEYHPVTQVIKYEPKMI
jgi:hypothetical protein